MNKSIFKIFIFLLVSNAFSGVINHYGGNIGLISGIYDLWESLEPGIQGNFFVEPKTILPVEINFGFTLQNKKYASEKLIMFPISLSYTYYFKSCNKNLYFLKFGFGGIFENVLSSPSFSNFDPLFITSLGVDFKLNKKFSLYSQISYLFVYQKYIEKARYNGNFLILSFGIKK
jgi:hypothetical protein